MKVSLSLPSLSDVLEDEWSLRLLDNCFFPLALCSLLLLKSLRSGKGEMLSVTGVKETSESPSIIGLLF